MTRIISRKSRKTVRRKSKVLGRKFGKLNEWRISEKCKNQYIKRSLRTRNSVPSLILERSTPFRMEETMSKSSSDETVIEEAPTDSSEDKSVTASPRAAEIDSTQETVSLPSEAETYNTEDWENMLKEDIEENEMNKETLSNCIKGTNYKKEIIRKHVSEGTVNISEDQCDQTAERELQHLQDMVDSIPQVSGNSSDCKNEYRNSKGDVKQCHGNQIVKDNIALLCFAGPSQINYFNLIRGTDSTESQDTAILSSDKPADNQNKTDSITYIHVGSLGTMLYERSGQGTSDDSKPNFRVLDNRVFDAIKTIQSELLPKADETTNSSGNTSTSTITANNSTTGKHTLPTALVPQQCSRVAIPLNEINTTQQASNGTPQDYPNILTDIGLERNRSELIEDRVKTKRNTRNNKIIENQKNVNGRTLHGSIAAAGKRKMATPLRNKSYINTKGRLYRNIPCLDDPKAVEVPQSELTIVRTATPITASINPVSQTVQSNIGNSSKQTGGEVINLSSDIIKTLLNTCPSEDQSRLGIEPISPPVIPTSSEGLGSTTTTGRNRFAQHAETSHIYNEESYKRNPPPPYATHYISPSYYPRPNTSYPISTTSEEHLSQMTTNQQQMLYMGNEHILSDMQRMKSPERNSKSQARYFLHETQQVPQPKGPRRKNAKVPKGPIPGTMNGVYHQNPYFMQPHPSQVPFLQGYPPQSLPGSLTHMVQESLLQSSVVHLSPSQQAQLQLQQQHRYQQLLLQQAQLDEFQLHQPQLEDHLLPQPLLQQQQHHQLQLQAQLHHQLQQRPLQQSQLDARQLFERQQSQFQQRQQQQRPLQQLPLDALPLQQRQQQQPQLHQRLLQQIPSELQVHLFQPQIPKSQPHQSQLLPSSIHKQTELAKGEDQITGVKPPQMVKLPESTVPSPNHNQNNFISSSNDPSNNHFIPSSNHSKDTPIQFAIQSPNHTFQLDPNETCTLIYSREPCCSKEVAVERIPEKDSDDVEPADKSKRSGLHLQCLPAQSVEKNNQETNNNEADVEKRHNAEIVNTTRGDTPQVKAQIEERSKIENRARDQCQSESTKVHQEKIEENHRKASQNTIGDLEHTPKESQNQERSRSSTTSVIIPNPTITQRNSNISHRIENIINITPSTRLSQPTEDSDRRGVIMPCRNDITTIKHGEKDAIGVIINAKRISVQENANNIDDDDTQNSKETRNETISQTTDHSIRDDTSITIKDQQEFQKKLFPHNTLAIKFVRNETIESMFAKVFPSCFMILSMVKEMQNDTTSVSRPVNEVANALKIRMAIKNIRLLLRHSRKIIAPLDPKVFNFFLFLMDCLTVFCGRIVKLLNTNHSLKENYISESEADIYKDVFNQLYEYLSRSSVTDYSAVFNKKPFVKPRTDEVALEKERLLIVDTIKQRKIDEGERNADFKDFMSHPVDIEAELSENEEDIEENPEFPLPIIIKDDVKIKKRNIEVIVLDSDSDDDANTNNEDNVSSISNDTKRRKISSNLTHNVGDIVGNNSKEQRSGGGESRSNKPVSNIVPLEHNYYVLKSTDETARNEDADDCKPTIDVNSDSLDDKTAVLECIRRNKTVHNDHKPASIATDPVIIEILDDDLIDEIKVENIPNVVMKKSPKSSIQIVEIFDDDQEIEMNQPCTKDVQNKMDSSERNTEEEASNIVDAQSIEDCPRTSIQRNSKLDEAVDEVTFLWQREDIQQENPKKNSNQEVFVGQNENNILDTNGINSEISKRDSKPPSDQNIFTIWLNATENTDCSKEPSTMVGANEDCPQTSEQKDSKPDEAVDEEHFLWHGEGIQQENSNQEVLGQNSILDSNGINSEISKRDSKPPSDQNIFTVSSTAPEKDDCPKNADGKHSKLMPKSPPNDRTKRKTLKCSQNLFTNKYSNPIENRSEMSKRDPQLLSNFPPKDVKALPAKIQKSNPGMSKEDPKHLLNQEVLKFSQDSERIEVSDVHESNSGMTKGNPKGVNRKVHEVSSNDKCMDVHESSSEISSENSKRVVNQEVIKFSKNDKSINVSNVLKSSYEGSEQRHLLNQNEVGNDAKACSSNPHQNNSKISKEEPLHQGDFTSTPNDKTIKVRPFNIRKNKNPKCSPTNKNIKDRLRNNSKIPKENPKVSKFIPRGKNIETCSSKGNGNNSEIPNDHPESQTSKKNPNLSAHDKNIEECSGDESLSEVSMEVPKQLSNQVNDKNIGKEHGNNSKMAEDEQKPRTNTEENITESNSEEIPRKIAKFSTDAGNDESIEAIESYLRETGSGKISKKYASVKGFKQISGSNSLKIQSQTLNENKLVGIATPNIKDVLAKKSNAKKNHVEKELHETFDDEAVSVEEDDLDKQKQKCSSEINEIKDLESEKVELEKDYLDSKILNETQTNPQRSELVTSPFHKNITQDLLLYRKPVKRTFNNSPVNNHLSHCRSSENSAHNEDILRENYEIRTDHPLEQTSVSHQESLLIHGNVSNDTRNTTEIRVPELPMQKPSNTRKRTKLSTMNRSKIRLTMPPPPEPIQLRTPKIGSKEHREYSESFGNHHFDIRNGINFNETSAITQQDRAGLYKYFMNQDFSKPPTMIPHYPNVRGPKVPRNGPVPENMLAAPDSNMYHGHGERVPQRRLTNCKELLRQAVVKKAAANSEMSKEASSSMSDILRPVPQVTPIPSLQTIYYDESVDTNGFVSQDIKEEMAVLSQKESLNAEDYVNELKILANITVIPEDFKDFYIFVARQQIILYHQPIAFNTFLELLNQSGLRDFHNRFVDYTLKQNATTDRSRQEDILSNNSST